MFEVSHEQFDCEACRQSAKAIASYMILCPKCGNKRCPKALDHRFKCTGSNSSGQAGEIDPAKARGANVVLTNKPFLKRLYRIGSARGDEVFVSPLSYDGRMIWPWFGFYIHISKLRLATEGELSIWKRINDLE